MVTIAKSIDIMCRDLFPDAAREWSGWRAQLPVVTGPVACLGWY